MKQLGVYYNNIKAGVLTELHPGADYVFQYDSEYLALRVPSISVSLPRRSESFKSAQLFPFFINMLPEGTNRSVICRNRRIDEKDYFGILAAMAGKDFIGAVNIKELL